MNKTKSTGLRWVTCSSSYGDFGESRHLVRRGSPKSICGKSISHPQLWYVDTVKIKCSECEKEEEKYV